MFHGDRNAIILVIVATEHTPPLNRNQEKKKENFPPEGNEKKVNYRTLIKNSSWTSARNLSV